jgi:hypothetical protein
MLAMSEFTYRPSEDVHVARLTTTDGQGVDLSVSGDERMRAGTPDALSVLLRAKVRVATWCLTPVRLLTEEG